MTTTSNIFVGISAWASSTSYSVGDRRSNGGNAYQCIKAGTSASSGGPSGTSSSITDGSAIWKYLAHVDYVTIPSWVSGIPGTLTQPVVGLLWDCGPITTTAGTEFFSFNGSHNTTSTNTITLKAAPGDSFRDYILANSGLPLAFNSSNGVRFVLPSTAGNTNYITVEDQNVIFDGLQFHDPISNSGSTIIAVRDDLGAGGLKLTVSHCLFDGVAGNGSGIFDCAGTVLITDTLIIDRQVDYGTTIGMYADAAGSKVVNTTIIATNSSPPSNGGALYNSVTGSYVRNCAIFGYNPLVAVGSASVNLPFDHCGFDLSALGTGATGAGGNQFSLTASNQFINSASDWRLKAGAGLIGKGISDTTDIPTADDIAGRSRVVWDIGAWAYFLPASSALSLEAMKAAGVASLSSPANTASAIATLETLQFVGTASQKVSALGVATTIFVQSVVAVGQSNASHGAAALPAISSTSAALLSSPASALDSFFPVAAAGQISGSASGSNSLLVLSAIGTADQVGVTVTFFEIACSALATPLLQFAGLTNIDWMAQIAPLTSFTNATASALTALSMSSVGQLGQNDLASASATVEVLAARAFLGSSCSCVATVLSLAATSSAASIDKATGTGNILSLSLSKPIPPDIAADAITPSLLAADGSGLLITADVLQFNLTSQTFGSGLATIPSLSCVAQAIRTTTVSGSESVLGLSATASALQIDHVSGAARAPVLSVAASATQRDMAAGSVSVERLSAAGSMSQSDAASGSAGLEALAAIGAAQGFTGASCSALVPTVTGSGIAVVGRSIAGVATLPPLTASATTSFAVAWSGAAGIAVSAQGLLGQIDSISGAASIQISAAVRAVGSVQCSGLGILPTITALGVAAQSRTAQSLAQIPALTVQATAVNTELVMHGRLSVMALSASGVGNVVGSLMSGSGLIEFSAEATAIVDVGAAVLVELEQLVAARAKLWVTPLGYEQGVQVVFWPA